MAAATEKTTAAPSAKDLVQCLADKIAALGQVNQQASNLQREIAEIHRQLQTLIEEGAKPASDGIDVDTPDGTCRTDDARKLCVVLQSAGTDSGRWERIEKSLRGNPEKMSTISRYLIDHGKGATLIISPFQDREGGEPYVEFIEARERNRESVKREVEIFNTFTPEQRNAAIESVIEADSAKQTKQLYTDDQKQKLRAKFTSECSAQLSSGDGLNFWQALVYAAHYECRLPTYEEDKAMAEKNSALADQAWTWRHNEEKSLLQILEGGRAPDGRRLEGLAYRRGNFAVSRYGARGGCVAGLRVPLA